MRSNTKSMVAPFVNALKKIEVAIIGYVRRRAEARRRRIALEEEFYRSLKKLHSAKMPILWEDEWRMRP